MPNNNPQGSGLPGLEGKDYQLVLGPNGQVYAVYSLQINGKTFKVSWRVEKKDLDRLGIKTEKLQKLSGQAFRTVNVMGSADDLTLHGDKVHPFQSFLKSLKDQFGHISWMSDAQYMSIMVESFAEGITDPNVIANKLSQTKWYQNTTEAQRQWQTMGKADRQAAIDTFTARMTDDLNTLYGEITDWQKNLTPGQIEKWAKQVASGSLGSGDAGYQVWLSQRRGDAEKIEGSAAWIEKQTTLESERDFMNKPENMYEQLRQDAIRWLGPQSKNMPWLSKDTLKQWSTDLVTGKKSEADWQQFLRKQAKAMYPYLGTDQTWMEFADPYKAKAESLWGRPLDWADPILADLMGKDAKGASTGTAMSYSDFETKLRQAPQFWQGPVARDEGYDMVAKLTSMFEGVTY